jgi:3-dehydroquinate dehydratase
VDAVIAGLGPSGYLVALDALFLLMEERATR